MMNFFEAAENHLRRLFRRNEEHVGFVGRIHLELREADGSLAMEQDFLNAWSQLGDAHVAARMCASPPTTATHMAIGSGSGQSTSATTLATETARVALSSGPTQGSGADDNTVVYVATFGTGVGTGVVSELALFTASSGGTMLNYSSGFTSFSKTSQQSLTWTITLRCGAS